LQHIELTDLINISGQLLSYLQAGKYERALTLYFKEFPGRRSEYFFPAAFVIKW
jgi:hypothetical protein